MTSPLNFFVRFLFKKLSVHLGKTSSEALTFVNPSIRLDSGVEIVCERRGDLAALAGEKWKFLNVYNENEKS